MLVQRLKYLDEQYVNVNLHDDDFFYAEHCDQDVKEKKSLLWCVHYDYPYTVGTTTCCPDKLTP